MMSRLTGSPAGSPSRSDRSGGAAGFTLIEVLVAFVVLAITMGFAVEIFSGGLRAARLADTVTTATLLAESRLESLGAEEKIAEGDSEGTDGDFLWRVAVRQMVLGEEDVEVPGMPDAFAVTVTVSWETFRGGRAVELTSMRITPK